MKVIDAIMTRRSIRKYKDKPIPWNDVATVVQAARFAPCAGNIFNLRCIVIKDEGQRHALAELSHQPWMQDAPIHILIVSETQKLERNFGTRGARIYTLHNAAAAAQNMLLMATDLGLGSCWVGNFEDLKVRRLCGIPPHVDPQIILTLGYADEHPEIPPKRSVEDMCNFGGFHGRIEGPKTGIGDYVPRWQAMSAGAKKTTKKQTKALSEKLKAQMEKYKKKDK